MLVFVASSESLLPSSSSSHSLSFLHISNRFIEVNKMQYFEMVTHSDSIYYTCPRVPHVVERKLRNWSRNQIRIGLPYDLCVVWTVYLFDLVSNVIIIQLHWCWCWWSNNAGRCCCFRLFFDAMHDSVRYGNLGPSAGRWSIDADDFGLRLMIIFNWILVGLYPQCLS